MYRGSWQATVQGVKQRRPQLSTALPLTSSVLIHVQLFATPWTIAHQAPLSMEFSRHEYMRGLPFPLAGNLPTPGIEPTSLASLAKKFS